MKLKYTLLVLSLILMFSISVSAAYSDYAINNLNLKAAINADQPLTVTMNISNNSSAQADVNVTLLLFNPEGTAIYQKTFSYTIPSNNSVDENVTIQPVVDVNLVSSTQPYAVRARITNETSGNISNNVLTKYFTVIKSTKKVPVPDMPTYFGFVIALLLAFVLSKDYKKNKKMNKK